MSLEALINLIQKEWGTLKGAPVVFIIVLILAFIAVYIAAKWRYDGIIEHLRTDINLKQTRIETKDEQLDDYRKRLHLIKVSGTTFSRMSNDELRNKTLDLTSKVRSFITKMNLERNNLSDQQMAENLSAQTEEEKTRIWIAQRNKSSQQYIEHQSYYDLNFKTDMILLRDELLSRLPKDTKRPRTFEHQMYESPNLMLTERAVNDLERLGKLLP